MFKGEESSCVRSRRDGNVSKGYTLVFDVRRGRF
jgi:hypothetical protein